MKNCRNLVYVALAVFGSAALLCLLSTMQQAINGVPLHYHNYVLPILFGVGVGLVFGVVYCVLTGRNRALLGQSRDLANEMASLLRVVPVCIGRIDSDGTIAYNSRGCLKPLGYEENELKGKSVLDLQPDAERNCQVMDILAMLAERRPKPAPWRGKIRAKDGRVADVDVHWDYNLDPEGRVSGITFAAMDVSEKLAYERSLRESEKTYRDLFDQAAWALFVHDRQGRFLDVNEEAARSLGYTKEELCGGMTVYDIDRDFTGNAEVLDFWSRDAWESVAFESRHIRKDGTDFPINITIIKTLYNGRQCVMAMVQDISGQKDYERSLRAERRRAEEASEVKSRFLANMSHEIRTPLNGIFGMLQLLGGTSMRPEQKEYVAESLTACNRLINLLSDILDVSRIEAGKVAIQKNPFTMEDVLADCVGLFAPAAGDKGIDISCSLDPAVPRTLLGDHMRVRQIMNNLIGNAVKFTTSGSIAVEASLLSGNRDGVRVLFSVADTGIGMPDETLEEMFQPFTQGSQGLERSHQGAGLGLAICKSLIAAMGGGLSVDSEPGAGTRVHFSILFDHAREQGVEADLVFVRSSQTVRPLRILHADDDRVSRIATTKMLERKGHTVTNVEHGGQVLELLADRPFDVLLLDIQMPVMDGVEAARAIRRGQAGPEAAEIPIVALTAYAMRGDKERFIEEGMNWYLAKPVDFDSLDKILLAVAQDKSLFATRLLQ